MIWFANLNSQPLYFIQFSGLLVSADATRSTKITDDSNTHQPSPLPSIILSTSATDDATVAHFAAPSTAESSPPSAVEQPTIDSYIVHQQHEIMHDEQVFNEAVEPGEAIPNSDVGDSDGDFDDAPIDELTKKSSELQTSGVSDELISGEGVASFLRSEAVSTNSGING